MSLYRSIISVSAKIGRTTACDTCIDNPWYLIPAKVSSVGSRPNSQKRPRYVPIRQQLSIKNGAEWAYVAQTID